jgi:hypothetical protein
LPEANLFFRDGVVVVGMPRTLGCVARTIFCVVIAGHSRSKNGVASLAYDPAIHAASSLAEIHRTF